MRTIFAVMLALLLAGRPAAAAELWEPGTRDPGSWDLGQWAPGDWDRQDKALALNLGVGAVALGWGAWAWDWGNAGPRFQDEGWFGRGTTEGGADKLGHAWSGYALSHIFALQYERWTYPREEAARYGALSSLGVMGLIEVGDAFSDDYGFSYQDMLFNALGAGFGYLRWQYPELARKLDFRVEYNPFLAGDYQADVTTDYSRLRYLLALKADGFDAIENPILKHLELHVGFYARHYEDYSPFRPGSDRREQHLYVGIGLNLTRLLQPHADVGAIFNYVQLPYTYVPLDRRIDR